MYFYVVDLDRDSEIERERERERMMEGDVVFLENLLISSVFC